MLKRDYCRLDVVAKEWNCSIDDIFDFVNERKLSLWMYLHGCIVSVDYINDDRSIENLGISDDIDCLFQVSLKNLKLIMEGGRSTCTLTARPLTDWQVVSDVF